MRSLNLISYAKLNLYLEVLGKHPDNYHSISTLFERISLFDQIRLRLLPQREIRIVSSNSSLPLGRKNLAFQAASLLKREFKVSQGVEINIKKHIPVACGLGGGSGNAAAVLIGLNRLWKLNLKVNQLVSLGRLIGADIPFFIYDCSFAWGTHYGDEIKVLKLPVKLWHIIVVPRIKVLSSLIYKRWDESTAKTTGRTSLHQSLLRMLKSGLLKKDFLKLKLLLFNSLERVSSAVYPVISRVKSLLSDLGLEAISMSGSGPAVFGLVSSRKEAYAVARQLKVKEENWDVFVARTV